VHPEHFAGLASITNHPIEAVSAEVKRVAKRGALQVATSPTGLIEAAVGSVLQAAMES
jgi:hypothetical protein